MEILKGVVFSKTQPDILLQKMKNVSGWSCEDITEAFTISYLSKYATFI